MNMKYFRENLSIGFHYSFLYGIIDKENQAI